MSFWNKRVQEISTEYDRGELNLSQGTIQKTIGYTHPQYTAKLYEKYQNDKGLDLIKDPDKEILKTINFVLDNKMTDININHDIKTTGFRNWNEVLSEKEVQIVEKRISNLLIDLNYE